MCEVSSQSLSTWRNTTWCTTNNPILNTWSYDTVSTEIACNLSTGSDYGNDTKADVVFEEEKVSEILWKIFPVIIFAVGMIGNLSNVAVVRQLGVKRQPTLVFILFLSITDSIVLISGLPRYWILYTFDYDTRVISNGMCKISLFSIYASMQYSSWILVGVCIERCVKTYFPFKYRQIYTFKSVTIGLFIILFCVCIIDMHFFWTNGINTYTEGSCDSLTDHDHYFDEYVFVFIDFGFLSAAPFLIMFVSNILLARVLKRIQTQRESMMHNIIYQRTQRVSVKMTRMLLITSIYFVVTTAPVSIYFIVDTYYRPKFNDEQNAKLDLAWTIVYLFQFSNYSVNFYLYGACNRRFRQEFRRIICCGKRLVTHKALAGVGGSWGGGGGWKWIGSRILCKL